MNNIIYITTVAQILIMIMEEALLMHSMDFETLKTTPLENKIRHKVAMDFLCYYVENNISANKDDALSVVTPFGETINIRSALCMLQESVAAI